ncbi:flavodoxin [Paracoccus aurantiacus]|uniref:Flavodoxin n=1 Tax=Paracoccus aurantiacus TaxID=2599412 RepID=A0A5C6RVS4_9RHOB|nr:flavodoxin [Paracoccus aurantiacus]TXB65660.1 flavodoxin [Paracoccus aurantiacus]
MTNGINRRDTFKAALLPFVAAQLAAKPAAAQTGGGSVVVYLSRSGNTRVLAGALSRRFNADLFELRPRDPWPADYDEMVDWASAMREQGNNVPLAEDLPGIDGYDTVFQCHPIWGMDLPAVTASFLQSHDLSGKTVIPIITHGGYGTGDAVATAQSLAPNARFTEAFVLECNQERDDMASLNAWLDESL